MDAGHSVGEEWSWSDSDGEVADVDEAAFSSAMTSNKPAMSSAAKGPGRLRGSIEQMHNGHGYRSALQERYPMQPGASAVVPGNGAFDQRKSTKAGVRQMVALGLCSQQAAEMFMQIEAEAEAARSIAEPSGAQTPPSGASRDQLEASEARLAASEARLVASERALRESEEQQLKLQAELMMLTLNPHQSNSAYHSGGVTAFDVARAQREAEKLMTLQRRVAEAEDEVMTLQRRVAEGEERERQQAAMQAKMEELLRLQEVALSEREEGSGALEKDLAERDAQVRLLTEKLSKLEHTRGLEQQVSGSEIAELKAKNQVLEDAILERDEQLRRTDGDKLRLHEIQMQEKENQLRHLEARLAANGGDQLLSLKNTFAQTLETREVRLASLEHESKQIKVERDEARKSYMSMQSTCRDLRMESEHLQMALTIVEPKVHVLQAIILDIQLHLQGQLNKRDNKIFSQQQHLDRTLPNMHGKIEEMKKLLDQRDLHINSMQQEIVSLKALLKNREMIVPELQDALDKQRQIAIKQQEELAFKSQRIETLQSALEQMQYALDRTQNMIGERDARIQLLQSSLDNAQPAMAIARKAIEERDMKLNAFHILLEMGESHVQENAKALDNAMQKLKEKDENLKVLQDMVWQKDMSISGMADKLNQTTTQMAEREWQLNAHASKIVDLQEKLHSIDREQVTEVRNSVMDVPDHDRIQVGAMNFKALRSLHFGSPRDLTGLVMRTVPPHADQDLQNGPLLKGRVALIERGIVSFQVKAVRAFAAGAIGVVFANDEDELYQPCIATPPSRNPAPIPILALTKSDAAMLADGMEISMFFGNDAISVAGSSISHRGANADSAQQPTARQRVLLGAHLQEWTRGKHTGSYLAGDSFIQVTPNAEIFWKNRRCRIKRVRDGFCKALSLAKPVESSSRCGFTVRLESDQRVSDVYDLELMAPSDHDKMQWIAGILAVVKECASSMALHYVGERLNSLPKGKGRGVFVNGDQYMGEWESGFGEGTENGIVPLPHGLGVFAWRNGDLYRGEWDKGVRSGFGTLETNDGGIFQGKWEDDRMSGPGIYMSGKREKYVGTMLEGCRHGCGVFTQQDGTKKCVEYCSGVETNKGPFPHPKADLQATLVQVSNDARGAAKTAAGRAEAAQALCQSAEGLLNELSASNPGHQTYDSHLLQRPAQIEISPAINSSTHSSRPGGTNLFPGQDQGAKAQNNAVGAPVTSHPSPSTSYPSQASQNVVINAQGFTNALPPTFSGVSPITNTTQTPYSSMGTGSVLVQSPPLHSLAPSPHPVGGLSGPSLKLSSNPSEK